MSEKSINVWLLLPNSTYYPMKAGISKMRERASAALLETPNVFSPVRKREILSYTVQLEFEGQRDRDDPVWEFLSRRYLKRGSDALVTFVIYDAADVLTGNSYRARRQSGYICLEEPGSGDGLLGAQMKGRIVYASEPEEGAFDADLKHFFPY